jgi:hypothetical protein
LKKSAELSNWSDNQERSLSKSGEHSEAQERMNRMAGIRERSDNVARRNWEKPGKRAASDQTRSARASTDGSLGDAQYHAVVGSRIEDNKRIRRFVEYMETGTEPQTDSLGDEVPEAASESRRKCVPVARKSNRYLIDGRSAWGPVAAC